jgi:Holliday junction resolvasome RuvABC endonuclease subunit
MIIGIDPSQRHTGICVLSDTDPMLIAETREIKTEELPILDSVRKIRVEIGELFGQYPDAVYSMEKMMPTATAGALLFYVQMAILEELESRTSKKLIHPLPVQLRSYVRRVTGILPQNKTQTVELAKRASGYTKRMSSHIADAYFLARMGKAVVDGMYEYKLSRGELPLLSWEVLGGC